MLLLLLLHLHQGAAARVPLHEYLHGEDYGYVEAYSGNQENQPQHGSDYNDDYNTEDSYEYKEDLDDDFRSGGGVDSEVNTKPKCSLSSRNASVAKVMLKVRKMQRGLLVARKVRLKSIPGRQADPLNFYSTHLRFLCRKQIRNIGVEEALFQSIFSKLATDNTTNLQASCPDSSPLSE